MRRDLVLLMRNQLETGNFNPMPPAFQQTAPQSAAVATNMQYS